MFLLGLFCGLLLAVLMFVIEVYLKVRNLGFKQLERIVDEKTRAKGAVLMPKKQADTGENVLDKAFNIITKKDE